MFLKMSRKEVKMDALQKFVRTLWVRIYNNPVINGAVVLIVTTGLLAFADVLEASSGDFGILSGTALVIAVGVREYVSPVRKKEL